MKIKTNIYHVTADNGESYEDFTGYAATIQAKSEKDVIQLGLKKLAEVSGMESENLCHFDSTLVFENVELEVPTPEPVTITVDDVDFTYHYDREVLEVKIAYESAEISKKYLDGLAAYLNTLVKTLQ